MDQRESIKSRVVACKLTFNRVYRHPPLQEETVMYKVRKSNWESYDENQIKIINFMPVWLPTSVISSLLLLLFPFMEPRLIGSLEMIKLVVSLTIMLHTKGTCYGSVYIFTTLFWVSSLEKLKFAFVPWAGFHEA